MEGKIIVRILIVRMCRSYKSHFVILINKHIILKGLGMVFNATFNNISLILAVSFIGAGNWSTRGKATDLPQVTDKLLY